MEPLLGYKLLKSSELSRKGRRRMSWNIHTVGWVGFNGAFNTGIFIQPLSLCDIAKNYKDGTLTQDLITQ